MENANTEEGDFDTKRTKLSLVVFAGGGFPNKYGNSPKGSSSSVMLYSTAASENGKGIVTAKGQRNKRVDPLDLTFMNNEAALKSKSTWEVFVALVVFQLCSIRPLVEHNHRVNFLPRCVEAELCYVRITYYCS